MKNNPKSLFPSLELLLLCVIVAAGFIYRYIGIVKGLSFWNDESNVALFARSWIENSKPETASGFSTGIYQILMYGVTVVSFTLFGITEFAGRLPSILAGTLLILAMYLIVKKILGKQQAIIAAALVSFSQIQLAWSTQLRPYIWLELFSLLVIFYLWLYVKSKKSIDKNIVIAGTFSIFASLFHGTGMISIGIIFIAFLYKALKNGDYKILFSIPILGTVFAILFYFSFSGDLESIKYNLLQFNFTPLHYRIFLTHNYLWLLAGSATGFIALYRKNKDLSLLLGVSVIFIFAIAILKLNSNYVRYSLTAFPLLYVLFAEGIVTLIQKITKNEIFRWLLVILVFALISQTGKLVLWPKYYYSINADVRENPIVDYKLAFSKINYLVKDHENVIAMDAWNDRVPWYMPGQKFIFLIRNGNGKTDPSFGEKMIGTAEEFEQEKKLYSSGIVMVEDWQSQTPEELKDHIRKNLKLEFTIQDLPYNENDHWGISVYSWGL